MFTFRPFMKNEGISLVMSANIVLARRVIFDFMFPVDIHIPLRRNNSNARGVKKLLLRLLNSRHTFLLFIFGTDSSFEILLSLITYIRLFFIQVKFFFLTLPDLWPSVLVPL